MARQHDTPFGAATCREPKYRTSCDNCQAAKVKCGQGKPACRRCSVHRLECVYSLSRRMGRPRAKRSGMTAASSSDSNNNNNNNNTNNNDSNNHNKDNNNTSDARGCAVSETTAIVAVAAAAAAARRTSPLLEVWDSGESTALLDEQSQGLIPWSPLAGGEYELVDDSGCQLTAEPLGSCLPTDAPMELDGVSCCIDMEFDMPSFLQNLSSSPTAQPTPPMSASGPRDLFASPLDLLVQMPPPATADDEKHPPSFVAAGSQLSLQDTRQRQQDFDADSGQPSQGAESSRQSMARICAMDHMLDVSAFDLASGSVNDALIGSTLSQGTTCFSHSSLSTNPSAGRPRCAATLLSSPSRTANNKRPRAAGNAEDGDGQEGEEEEEEEETFIPSSASSSSSSSTSRRPEAATSSDQPGVKAPSGTVDKTCGCVAAVSRCIVSLRTAEQQQEGASSPLPLDGALLMEGEVAASLSRLDRCKTCRGGSAVQLLALVGVRMLLNLLQKTVRDEFASRRRQPGWSPLDPGAGKDPVSGGGEGGGEGTLCIGKFKVPPRPRFRFLRRLLQARFYRLAVLVEEHEKLVQGLRSRDSFAGASSLLLADISQGLRTVMGWLELWSSKP